MKIVRSADGVLRVELDSIGVVTYAKDLEDACTAIGEACLIYQLNKSNEYTF